MDGADFFWTSGNCSTMVLPDSGIVGNEAPRPPSTGGISETWHRGIYGKKLFQVFLVAKLEVTKTPWQTFSYSTEPFETTHQSGIPGLKCPEVAHWIQRWQGS